MLKRTQFEYLQEGADTSVLVTIKPIDRIAVYKQLENKELPEDMSIGEFNRRLVHAACLRSELTGLGYDEWFASLDEFAESEADEPGEAGATPAPS